MKTSLGLSTPELAEALEAADPLLALEPEPPPLFPPATDPITVAAAEAASAAVAPASAPSSTTNSLPINPSLSVRLKGSKVSGSCGIFNIVKTSEAASLFCSFVNVGSAFISSILAKALFLTDACIASPDKSNELPTL